jgi:hypothetical protein
MSKILSVLILLLTTHGLSAQQKLKQQLIWYGYNLSIPLNSRWSVQAEVHERHFINPEAQHQFLLRGHLRRTLGQQGWEVAAGLAVSWQSTNDPKASNKLTVPEIRPHIEFAGQQALGKVILSHRYRVEGRFFKQANATRTVLEDDFSYSTVRMRYRIEAGIPLFKLVNKQFVKARLNDEILLNTFRKGNAGIFDQNRIYAGLSIGLRPGLSFDIGYMHLFQQQSSATVFDRDVLRCTIFHAIRPVKQRK